MLIAGVAASAALGAVIGSVLSVVAWRVPKAVPLRAGRRAHRDPPTSLWSDVPILPHHRRDGDTPRSPASVVALRPPAFELGTGLLFALMTWRFGVTWELPAYLALAAAGLLLSVIDLQHQRLPNVVIAPFALVALLSLTLGAAFTGAWESLARAALGAVALFVLYLVLSLISPASLGMGDVKLAGVLGLLMAYLSWRTLFYGGTGAFVMAALISIGILVTRRGNRRTQVPFGPSMLVAAVVAVVAS